MIFNFYLGGSDLICYCGKCLKLLKLYFLFSCQNLGYVFHKKLSEMANSVDLDKNAQEQSGPCC